MKSFVATLACLFWVLILVAPALALETRGHLLVLNEAERRACEVGGGCEVIPVYALGAAFLSMRQETYDQAFSAGAQAGYRAGYRAGRKAAKDPL